MRQWLVILLILNLIATITLIFTTESLCESAEVAAESLPPIVRQLANRDIESSDRRERIAHQQMSYIDRILVSNQDRAQDVRIVVRIIALLLFVNAAICWYVRPRRPT